MMSAPLRRRLAELDAQIVEQKRVLDELQRTRSDVERELHATATFPVLKLPTEITAEIFLCCLPLFLPLRIPHATFSAPINLARVCQLWRNIVLATPALWSKLDVWVDELSTKVVSQPGLIEGRIDRWFSLARNCPLSFDFHCLGQPFELGRLRGIIHRWSHRIRYIHLHFGPAPLTPAP
ncbi:hypothetical protein MSAN_01493400 [Mycena sanguinolenta]|uniref:F-box domain-containing protein n=1 Tax=Mycena sanguinolenta TaxID=230812 RepID=A0A8H6Y7K3_9AGAR|nr:hypothetical protein MSAN_01493400 [Mycena sanguinolenta]